MAEVKDTDTKDGKKKFSANIYSDEGRERYLDMVQRERDLLNSEGLERSLEQMLVTAGGFNINDQDAETRSSATGDQIRAAIPSQAWMPHSIHIIELTDAILHIAPLHEIKDRQEENLVATLERAGFKVDEVEQELWDRRELMETLRTVHDSSADRCEKTLATWLSDMDNGLYLNQFMRDMMAEALQMRASDIHLTQDNIEGAPNWIRYRIDGDLTPMHLLPKEAMGRLTTSLKRDAAMNFGDRLTPQDGRFSFSWQGRNIDVRVAAGPHGQDGEKITMRLLDRATLLMFSQLFRRHEHVADHMQQLLEPEVKGDGGLILLSGPTGSGKTTTLYACVQKIDRRRRHVLTIEDPIEYEMRYATQWQVSSGPQGVEFSDLIRASLRHDPDYIIVGEMRDGETVETALRASESGHTVMSTIHADTAVQTLERLRSFLPKEKDRASTYTLSQQIRAILNQRLIKTLCQGCSQATKAERILSEQEMEMLDVKPNDILHLHSPNGCDLCNRTGYLGRTLLLESLLFEGGEIMRQSVYERMLENAYSVPKVDGVRLVSRADGIKDLVKDQKVDPRVGVAQIQDFMMTEELAQKNVTEK